MNSKEYAAFLSARKNQKTEQLVPIETDKHFVFDVGVTSGGTSKDRQTLSKSMSFFVPESVKLNHEDVEARLKAMIRPSYYLLGEQAADAYLNGGIDYMFEQAEKHGYDVAVAYYHPVIIDIYDFMYSLDGYFGYTRIEEDEFVTVQNYINELDEKLQF